MLPHSRLRRLIAEHMVASKRTSPHVTTVMEADLAAVVAHRMAHKAEFAAKGVALTFTPYFIQAVIAGLKAVPSANAVYRDDGLLLKRRYHIGMATAVADGLLVPVIHDADDYSLLGLARQVGDLAQRARSGQLKPDEIQGSTFTITNHGTSGSLFAMPIINQPNVGILGVGAIQKRAVVISRGHPIEPSADELDRDPADGLLEFHLRPPCAGRRWRGPVCYDGQTDVGGMEVGETYGQHHSGNGVSGKKMVY